MLIEADYTNPGVNYVTYIKILACSDYIQFVPNSFKETSHSERSSQTRKQHFTALRISNMEQYINVTITVIIISVSRIVIYNRDTYF